MNSHTVQRAYLCAFVLDTARDRRFHVYSKINRVWRTQSPRSATTRSDYYSIELPDGSRDDSLEDDLNMLIESPGIGPLRKLAAGDKLSMKERHALALYVGCMMTRTTKMRSFQDEANLNILDPETAISYIQQNRDRFEQKVPTNEIDNLIHSIRVRGHGFQLPNSWYLHSLSRIEKYGALIASMNWVVERTRSPHWFITSDHPAFVCRPTQPHLPFAVGLTRDDLGSELCFPLTSTAFLRASFGQIGTGRIQASKTRVRELNRRVAIHATDDVITPERTDSIDSVIVTESDFFVRPMDPQWVHTRTR